MFFNAFLIIKNNSLVVVSGTSVTRVYKNR